MRTTLDIDEDVLSAAKDLAEARRSTAGRVISELARQALTQPPQSSVIRKNGFLVLPKRGGLVTTALVKRLSEDES